MNARDPLDDRLRQLVGEMASVAPPAPDLEPSGDDGLSPTPPRPATRRAMPLLVGATLLLALIAALAMVRSGDDTDDLETAEPTPSDDASFEPPPGGDATVPARITDSAGRTLFVGREVPLAIDPWYAEQVVTEVLANPALGADEAERQRGFEEDGWTIRLGLDPDAGAAAAGALDQMAAKYDLGDTMDAAIVVVDHRTGQIVAATSISGSALSEGHPAGSGRLATYATALGSGYTLDTPVDGTGPCEVELPGATVTVENFAGNAGAVEPLLEQIMKSNHCALTRLEAELGTDQVQATATALAGTEVTWSTPPLVASPELTATAHVTMVATVANDGTRPDVGLIAEIVSADGVVLHQRSSTGEPVLAATSAAALDEAMRANARGGTGTRADRLDHPVGVLTGTLPDFTSAWAVGTSDGFSAAVWFAEPDRSPLNVWGLGRVTGGSLPAEAWGVAMAEIADPGPDAIATLRVAALDLSWTVVEGISESDLQHGPGHYPGSAPIGFDGNAAVAGHRTTWGAPFERIDELQPGDEILVTSQYGQFTYRVVAQADASGHRIVDPSEVSVLDDTGIPMLTLTSHHPKFSARQRIVVQAELVGEPVDSNIDFRVEPIQELP